MVFKLPRAGRAFIKGLASEGYRGIMAKAQEEADALKTEQEQQFELLKIKDKAHLDKLTRIELLNLQDENAAKALKRAEDKEIDDTRTTLSGMGWEDDTLDYLESIKALNSMATFNVWKSQFDPYFKNTVNENDYHLLSVPNPDNPGETISWQQDFLRQIKKSTNIINNANVASTLENENNISSNVVKTQIDTTGGATADVATVSASDDTASDLPARTIKELNEKVAQRSATEDTSTVDTSSNVGASSTVEATSSWLDKFRKTQIVPQKVITLGIEDRGNPDAEALLGAGYSLYDLPDDGTEIIKLTYDNASGTYNQVREKLSKTIKEKNDNLNTRQNQLTSALLQQPFWGLTKEVRTKLASGEIDINTFDAGLSMVPENQVKFVSMQNNLLLLNDYYTSIGEPIMPAKLVNQTVALYDMYNKKEGMVDKTAKDIVAIKAGNQYEGTKLTGEMIVDDLSQILKITGNIPVGTTALDTENRNKVIQRQIDLYKAALVTKTENPLHGDMVDRILESFARGNADGNFWDEVQDDRAPSGTFEQAIDFDPTDEISQEQIEPDIIDMQDERDEVRELLSELPSTLEDNNVETVLEDKDSWLKSNQVETAKEIGLSNWNKKYRTVEGEGLLGGMTSDYDSKTGLKKFVNPDLPAKHVEPRPKGAIYHREWDRLWSKTHNNDGTPK
jgi:hypothetical protein